MCRFKLSEKPCLYDSSIKANGSLQWVRLNYFDCNIFPAMITPEKSLFPSHYLFQLYNSLKFKVWVPGFCSFLCWRAERMLFLAKRFWSELSRGSETAFTQRTPRSNLTWCLNSTAACRNVLPCHFVPITGWLGGHFKSTLSTFQPAPISAGFFPLVGWIIIDITAWFKPYLAGAIDFHLVPPEARRHRELRA